MGRRAYPLSPEALAEAKRFMREGKRTKPRRDWPSTPSYRDLARHLRERGLTAGTVGPGVLFRALRRKAEPAGKGSGS